MRIFKQLIKEFLAPFIFSVLWVIYNLNGGEWTVKLVINTFGPSFFILSWGLAQYFRIKKQTKTEDSFESMEIRFKELMDKLEVKAEETIAHISGGDSYPLIQFGMVGAPDAWGFIAMSQGKYPLYDVNVRITDLQQLAKANDPLSASVAAIGKTVHVGNMIPSQCNVILTVDVKNISELSFNIFFTARNGLFTQLLRLKKINNSWLSAIQVMNKDGDTICELVDKLFPRGAGGNVNW